MEQSGILSSLKIPPNYNVEVILEKEFKRMKGHCYLDHAGAALYSEEQVHQFKEQLTGSLLGNPHSRHMPSDTTTQNLEAARHRILEHFNTTSEEYDLIFTSGATAALRLLAEHFDWNNDLKPLSLNILDDNRNKAQHSQQNSREVDATETSSRTHSSSAGNTIELDKAQHGKQDSSPEDSSANPSIQQQQHNRDKEESLQGAFVYLQENHTSVLGMRGPVHQASCDIYCLTTAQASQLLREGTETCQHSVINAKNLSVTECEKTLTGYPGSVTNMACASLSYCEDLAKTPVKDICAAVSMDCAVNGNGDSSLTTHHDSTTNIKDFSVTSFENLIPDIKNSALTAGKDIYVAGSKGSTVNGHEDLATAVVKPKLVTKCLSMTDTKKSLSNTGLASQVISISQGTASHTIKEKKSRGRTKRRNCLFAYSAQCNFSGSKAPLEWIKRVQEGALDGLILTPPMNKNTACRSGANKGCSEAPNWYVVLDAAGLVATGPLDLSQWKPDFVPVSFYKMVGYPTGLGCLLVGRRAWGVLGRAYQGGGTVLMVDSRRMVTVPRPTLHDRFEDGTQSFLSIPAVRHGLDTLHRLTGSMHNIASHVYHLARYTHHTLRSMQHSNGTPVARLYLAPGDTWQPHTHGSIVNFNLLNPDGSCVGYAQVERVASLYNIHLRTGCMCNPGACQAYLSISPDKLLNQFRAGHVCGDAVDLVDGEPTGSVRVSFGYSSTYKDADLLLTMVRECFVEEPMTLDLTWMTKADLTQLKEGKDGERGRIAKTEEEQGGKGGEKERMNETEEKRKTQVMIEERKKREDRTNNNDRDNDTNNDIKTYKTTVSPSLPRSPLPSHSSLSLPCTTSPSLQSSASQHTALTPQIQPSSTHRLTDIVVYPVKSCGGVHVGVWELGGAGLKLDRHWMVVSGAGATLTQKRLPHMALITPRFDLERGEMILSYDGEAEELHIPVDPAEPPDTSRAALCGGRVCGVRVKGLDCGEAAGEWLSRVLKTPDLRLMMQTSHRTSKLSSEPSGLAGESLSLANESQYLIIHRPSVRSLLKEINSRGLEQLTENELVARFRGNLVVDGGQAYEEDSWCTLTINSSTFQVQGGCRRCQMVCVVPGSGQRTREPMLSLASARGSSMLFGVHASAPDIAEENIVCVGTDVQVTMKCFKTYSNCWTFLTIFPGAPPTAGAWMCLWARKDTHAQSALHLTQ